MNVSTNGAIDDFQIKISISGDRELLYWSQSYDILLKIPLYEYIYTFCLKGTPGFEDESTPDQYQISLHDIDPSGGYKIADCRLR